MDGGPFKGDLSAHHVTSIYTESTEYISKYCIFGSLLHKFPSPNHGLERSKLTNKCNNPLFLCLLMIIDQKNQE